MKISNFQNRLFKIRYIFNGDIRYLPPIVYSIKMDKINLSVLLTCNLIVTHRNAKFRRNNFGISENSLKSFEIIVRFRLEFRFTGAKDRKWAATLTSFSMLALDQPIRDREPVFKLSWWIIVVSLQLYHRSGHDFYIYLWRN